MERLTRIFRYLLAAISAPTLVVANVILWRGIQDVVELVETYDAVTVLQVWFLGAKGLSASMWPALMLAVLSTIGLVLAVKE